MEANGLVEVMAMAEGALFRYGKTGERYEPPCWAMGGCSIGGRPMWFQLCVMDEGEDGPRVDVQLSLRDGKNGAPSWKLWVGADGAWDGKLYSGGRNLSASEWELDGAIEETVRRRNNTLAWATHGKKGI